MGADDLNTRLAQINWQDYSHPCYPSSHFARLSSLIVKLFDAELETSYTAAAQLWNLIAHQGIVGSIAIPVLPFLIERIQSSPPTKVMQELVEIISYFSQRLEPPDTSKWTPLDWEVAKRSFNYPDDYQWTHELRGQMCDHVSVFESLKLHADEDVRDFAKKTVENVETYCKTNI